MAVAEAWMREQITLSEATVASVGVIVDVGAIRITLRPMSCVEDGTRV